MNILMKYHDCEHGYSNTAIDMNKASTLIQSIVNDALKSEDQVMSLNLEKYFPPQRQKEIKIELGFDPDDELQFTDFFYEDLEKCTVKAPYQVDKEITIYEDD